MIRATTITTGCLVLFATAAGQLHGGIIPASEYSVSRISRNWSFGSTGWAHGDSVDPVSDLAMVEELMSDGYADDFGGISGATNGIYAPRGFVAFEFNSGADYELEKLTFVSSKASGGTSFVLNYSLDGGQSLTASTVTATSLGMYPLLAGSLSPGTSFSLDFGSVVADSFNFGFIGGLTSVHEIIVSGTPVVSSSNAVPEPGTFALLGIGGCALMAYRWKHRQRIHEPEKLAKNKL